MEFNTRHINFNGIVNSLPLSWQRFLGSVRNARKEDLPLMIVSQCKTTFKNEPIFWSNSNKAFPKKISFWSNKAFPKKIKWKILWSSSLFSSTNQTWKKNNNDIHKNRYVSHTSNICIISLKPYNIHFMMITYCYYQIRTLICFFCICKVWILYLSFDDIRLYLLS